MRKNNNNSGRRLKIRHTKEKIGIVFAVLTIIAGCVGLYFVMEKEENDNESKEYYERLKEEIQGTPTDAEEGFTVDWDALEGLGVVAWIRFGDTVDYPVMQADDNSYYLRRLPDGTPNTGGSLFLNCNNSPDFSDLNSVIYGHNMSAGTMFGQFKYYLRREKEIPDEIYLYLPDGTRHTYRVFSINETKYDGTAYKTVFSDVTEYENFQKEMLDTSAYDVGGTVNTERRMLTLSTCSVNGAKKGNRVVILGIERYTVQIQEPADWYIPE